MGDYKTTIVGMDGSKSSLFAVEHATSIAAISNATLVIGYVYYKTAEDASKTLRQDSVQVFGDDLARKNLATAKGVAKAVGAIKVETEVRSGSPVEALVSLVTDRRANLLMAGNRGINSLTGRLPGPVPADVARQSDCDVATVHTVN